MDATLKTNKPAQRSIWLSVIGCLQLVVCLLLALQLFTVAAESLEYWISAVLAAVNGVAGIQTLRQRPIGYWLSLWNHVAQIPALAIWGHSFHYVGSGDLVIYLAFGIIESDSSLAWLFGLDAEIIPRMSFTWIPPAVPESFFNFGIDLLAVAFAAAILRALPDSSTSRIVRVLLGLVRGGKRTNPPAESHKDPQRG